MPGALVRCAGAHRPGWGWLEGLREPVENSGQPVENLRMGACGKLRAACGKLDQRLKCERLLQACCVGSVHGPGWPHREATASSGALTPGPRGACHAVGNPRTPSHRILQS